MNKEDFLDHIQMRLGMIISDTFFDLTSKELLKWSLLKESHSIDIDEDMLWNYLLTITTGSSILIIENTNLELAYKCLRISAEIYERLSLLSNGFDREYTKILAALCYDISGYQANAYCIIKTIWETYQLESSLTDATNITDNNEHEESYNVDQENYVLRHIQNILLKRILIAKNSINGEEKNPGIHKFNSWISKWFEVILNDKVANTDSSEDYLYNSELSKAYEFFAKESNLPLSELIWLLRIRIKEYDKRSIKNQLLPYISDNLIWKKYIKLLAYNVYSNGKIKSVNDRVSKFEFWTSQIRALESWLLNKSANFIIQMPTSSWKTFIAELTILKHLIDYPGKKCIYIAPFRSLSSEKEEELWDNLLKLWYSVSTLSGSYEVDEFQDYITENTDVLIATPEKVDLLFRLKPELFDDISLIVIDEWHIISDISTRATLLEFLVIRIKRRVTSIKFLYISAVMPDVNAEQYSKWLNKDEDSFVIRARSFDWSSQQWEPTRKMIGKFTWIKGDQSKLEFYDSNGKDLCFNEIWIITRNDNFPKSESRSNDKYKQFKKYHVTILLTQKFIKDGNLLIFCAQPRHIETLWWEFISYLQDLTIGWSMEWNRLLRSYFYAKKWYWENSVIAKCIERWIWLHYWDIQEEVKRSIEDDYRSGNLCVLIANNTISQWINFPIRTLIVHSVLIWQNNPLKNRDFQNLIGRAWRAGKETEWKIIYIVNSNNDLNLFNSYIKKDNIEKAYSLFYTLAKNHTNEHFHNNIKLLTEPYLFDLIIDEAIDDNEITEEIIWLSLFKIQMIDDNINLDSIRNEFRSVIAGIKSKTTNRERIVFWKTWLSLSSNKLISDYIDKNLEWFIEIIFNGKYETILVKMLELLDTHVLWEMEIDKLNNIQPSEFLEIILWWINWNNTEILISKFEEKFNNRGYFFILQSQGFLYKYTWFISAFMLIFCDKLNMEFTDLPHEIKNLTTYIKYWSNDINACILKSLWVHNRDTAIYVATMYTSSWKSSFISWFANISHEDLVFEDLSQTDIENILNVALKLVPKSQSISFIVKWIFFDESRRSLSKGIVMGDLLTLERDVGNKYDSYAVKVLTREWLQLWFVPREIAKNIAVDIDLENNIYYWSVESVSENINWYNDITCSLF